MKRAQSALQFISPIDRQTWIMCGMALQSQFGDAARDVWMEWSRQADSFKEQDARSVWKSFRGTGVSIASLFHEAKQQGFKDDQHYAPPTRDQIEAQQRAVVERQSKEGRERHRLAQDAAKKADWILNQCKPELHAYLFSKGFKEMKGLVWRPDDQTNLLCIPMYVGHDLVGVQMIDKEGGKKYLSGQVTSKAEFCINSGLIGATHYWVEGYATGLSLRECLHALKRHYIIHITFSAGNLKRMAHSGYVIADHDHSGVGQVAAESTGLPFYLPEMPGEDFNDQYRRLGLFKCSQMLRKWLQETKENEDWYSG